MASFSALICTVYLLFRVYSFHLSIKLVQGTCIHHCPHLPGEKMSGLKRISKDVLLIEPTALQAFRTTSRLLGSVYDEDHIQVTDT